MENDLILYPKLKISQIVKGKTLPNIVKTSALIMSHSLLWKRATDKAEILGKEVRDVTEFMTSQTCGRCFFTYKFTGDTYNCEKCGLVIGRDVNAARLIYLHEYLKINFG